MIKEKRERNMKNKTLSCYLDFFLSKRIIFHQLILVFYYDDYNYDINRQIEKNSEKKIHITYYELNIFIYLFILNSNRECYI